MLAPLDRKPFFKDLRRVLGIRSWTQSQVEGLDAFLDECQRDPLGLRHMRPVRPTNDVPDRLSVNSVVERNHSALLASGPARSDHGHISFGDLRRVDSGTACRSLRVRVAGISLSGGHEPVDSCMANVLSARSPFQIPGPVVRLYSALVVHLRSAVRRFSKKGASDESVYGIRAASAVARQPYGRIAVSIELLAHHMRSLAMAVSNAPRGGHHSAKIGDGIQSFESRARSPLLYGSLLLSHDGPPLRISGQSCGGVSAPSRLAAILPLNSSVYWGFSS